MRRAKPLESKLEDRLAIAAREAAIRLASRELSQAQAAAAMIHAKAAAAWIAAHRPDVSFGAEPELQLIAESDHYSLVELEGSGYAGKAVKLTAGAFGDLWWCDPEGREPAVHDCLLYADQGAISASARTVLMRFRRFEQL